MNERRISSSQVPIRMRSTQEFVIGSIVASLPVNAFITTGDVAIEPLIKITKFYKI